MTIINMTEFAERINPRKFNFSPMMGAIVGAIIGHDYGARDRRGGRLTSLSITSDGFVVAGSTASDGGGAFIGSAGDLERNLEAYMNELDPADAISLKTIYRANVRDWRHL